VRIRVVKSSVNIMLMEVNWLKVVLVIVVMVELVVSLMINMVCFRLMVVISVMNSWNVSLMMDRDFMAI